MSGIVWTFQQGRPAYDYVAILDQALLGNVIGTSESGFTFVNGEYQAVFHGQFDVALTTGTIISFAIYQAGTLVMTASGEAVDLTVFVQDKASVEQLVEHTFTGGIMTVYGSAADDGFHGSYFADRLYGYGGGDGIFAGNGNDLLIGGNGRDFLYGEVGCDAISGGPGRDFVNGGRGRDYLSGGAANDIFAFDTAVGRANADRIVDFSHGHDLFHLYQSAFGIDMPVGAMLPRFFHVGAAAHDANDRVIYNQATGWLYFDPDGKGGSGHSKFALLTDVHGMHPVLSASDFMIV